MAKSKSRRKGRKTRRPTKTEIKRQKALERFILAIVTAVIFFFAMARLGIFGITVYNLVRLAVGSLAYVLMVAVLLYFLGFKWFHKNTGLVGGFVVTMIGLMKSESKNVLSNVRKNVHLLNKNVKKKLKKLKKNVWLS